MVVIVPLIVGVVLCALLFLVGVEDNAFGISLVASPVTALFITGFEGAGMVGMFINSALIFIGFWMACLILIPLCIFNQR